MCVNWFRQVLLRVGVSVQRRVDSHFAKTRPVILRKVSCSFLEDQDHNVTLNGFIQQAVRRKGIVSVLIDSVSVATLCLKPNLLLKLFSLSRDVSISHRKRYQMWQLAEWTRWIETKIYTQKSITVIEIWEFESWNVYKTTINNDQHIYDNFTYKYSLVAEQLSEEIKKGHSFDCVQGNLELHEELKAIF